MGGQGKYKLVRPKDFWRVAVDGSRLESERRGESEERHGISGICIPLQERGGEYRLAITSYFRRPHSYFFLSLLQRGGVVLYR